MQGGASTPQLVIAPLAPNLRGSRFLEDMNVFIIYTLTSVAIADMIVIIIKLHVNSSLMNNFYVLSIMLYYNSFYS